MTVTDAEVADAVRELGAAGLAIGESGAAPLAALRALVTDTECNALRVACGLGTDSRVALVATEGLTGVVPRESGREAAGRARVSGPRVGNGADREQRPGDVRRGAAARVVAR